MNVVTMSLIVAGTPALTGNENGEAYCPCSIPVYNYNSQTKTNDVDYNHQINVIARGEIGATLMSATEGAVMVGIGDMHYDQNYQPYIYLVALCPAIDATLNSITLTGKTVLYKEGETLSAEDAKKPSDAIKYAEVRYIGNGTMTYKQRLSIRKPAKDEMPDFFSLDLLGKVAEIMEQYVKKGDSVSVNGKLHVRANDGKVYYTVKVDKVTLCGGGGNYEPKQSGSSTAKPPVFSKPAPKPQVAAPAPMTPEEAAALPF